MITTGCEIILFHNQFASQRASGTCNNGAVIGRSIGTVNNSYTSELIIYVTPALDRRQVVCSMDNGTEFLVDTATLLITRGNSYTVCIFKFL